MHVCNAVKYLSVITNNLVLGGVLHWRWDWGHISSSYNFSSAPFCAEVLWRDKLPCCSSEIPVFSRFGRSPPWVLLGFETVWVKGGFGQHFPSPQLSATNIIKNYYHCFFFPSHLREVVILLLVADLFFLIIVSAACLGRRGQDAVNLNKGQQPFSFWLGRALLKLIGAQPFWMRAGSFFSRFRTAPGVQFQRQGAPC